MMSQLVEHIKYLAWNMYGWRGHYDRDNKGGNITTNSQRIFRYHISVKSVLIPKSGVTDQIIFQRFFTKKDYFPLKKDYSLRTMMKQKYFKK